MIKVLYFAVAREAAGLDEESLPAGAPSVAALRVALSARHPALARVLPRCRIAVDQAFAADADPVPDGAEVAVIHTVGFIALFGLLIGVTLFGDLPRLFRR